MHFRSTIQIPKAKQGITHQQSVLCMGSCFATHIVQKLSDSGFEACNPFSALYNPVSIAQAVAYASQGTLISPSALIWQDDKWHHMDFHSDFSHSNPQQAAQQINNAIAQAHAYWQKSHVLIITLGTAWCYTWQQTGNIVGNCHRLPAQQFTRKRLTLDEITQTLSHICTQAKDKQIILTVSPIRHWKDGAHQNQLSKALLLLACEQMEQKFEQVTYFPSYEIMMDDLRDYRFYADDMMHPSAVAVQYIWERFSDTYFSEITQQACIERLKISQMQAHRPSNTQGEAYKQLQEKIALQLQKWKEKYL